MVSRIVAAVGSRCPIAVVAVIALAAEAGQRWPGH